MNIDAKVKSIQKLSEYFFVVPDYQREYVWKPDDQVEQMLTDIDNEFEPGIEEQNSYFLGSLIIVKNKDKKYDVIDGQQRLTTIILALCAIRNLLKDMTLSDIESEYLRKIQELISNFDIETNKTTLRLDLQYEDSKDYLVKLVNGIEYEDDLTASIQKMKDAFVKLKGFFEGYLKLDQETLIKFIRYFLTKIEMVIIESENLSSALKIFETINQRGMGLNAMDLVKNLLFSQANETDFNKIKEIWKEITANLRECDEDESPLRFLRYFLMARYHDGIVREDEIYKWIISPKGKKSTNYETKPLELAKELKKISKRYSDLVLATGLLKDGGSYPNITNIGYVNKYKSRQHLILLLALDSNVEIQELEYLGTQIESFFFFSNTIGIQAKNNERLFAQWASKLRGKRNIEQIKAVINETFVTYIKDKIVDFKSEFLNINHNGYNPLYRLRYVLGKIENTLLVKSGLPHKGHEFFDKLQIEHILPQTPKDAVIPEDFSDMDEYKRYLFKLGNVTLLESAINQAVNKYNDMSIDWFGSKQSEYIKSDVLGTNLLNHHYTVGKSTQINRVKGELNYSFDQWNKKAITKRQEILMDLAFETWKLADKRVDK